MADDVLTPAVMVALVAVILQGIKAVYDLWHNARTRKISAYQQEIAHTIALINLVDVLPVEEGEKIAAKIEIGSAILSGKVPERVARLFRL